MTRGIERGAPFDGAYKQEAELVGPYPVWALWKGSLLAYLAKIGIQLNNGTESTLKEFYINRRLFQKGEIDFVKLIDFNRQFVADHPEITQEPLASAVRYITTNTEKLLAKNR